MHIDYRSVSQNMSFRNFLSHASTSLGNSIRKPLCQLETRPDVDFILFRGNPDETGPYTFKGRVVLMNTEKIEVKSLRVVFEGMRKTMHDFGPTAPAGTQPIVNRACFLRTQIIIRDDNGHHIRNIPAGNHEWPFEIQLPGDIPASIEGMASYIVYNLSVKADRGVFGKDLDAEKRVRVIRTLSEDSFELVDAHSIPGVWPDKVKYNFDIPAKAAVFGTTLTTDVELTPLGEKVTFDKIKVIVNEIVRIKTHPAPQSTESQNSRGMWRTETTVVTRETPISGTCNAIDTEADLPMYSFKLSTPLPRSLKDCRQDVEHNEFFEIRHHVYYEVTINNPEGHQSMLRANHELKLFISPSLPLNEDNEIPQLEVDRVTRDFNLLGDMQAAPPLYNTHRLDRLYEDIDMGGYITPTPWSGTHTPRALSSISRRGSSDNIGSLAITNGSPPQRQQYYQAQNHEPSAAALEHRLANLQANGVEHWHGDQQQQGHNQHSNMAVPGDSPSYAGEYFEQSSRARVQSLPQTPQEVDPVQHIEYDMDALERVTSYNTAVRSRPVTSFTEEPPEYGVAVTH